MTPLKLIFIWLLIAGVFVGLGFLENGAMVPPHGLDGPVACGSLGVGAASSFLIGLHIVAAVRKARLSRLAGLSLLLLSSGLTVPIVFFTINAASSMTPGEFYLFQGEHGWVALGAYYFALWTALGIFVALFPWVLTRTKHEPEMVYQGLRCVACRKPIEAQVSLCSHCGWTQPA